MEKRLETSGQATLNEGGGNFYRANIREEDGEYYAYISDGKNVVAKHKSKAKMEAIRWAGDRMRAEIASRILYNPDTKLRGSYQSDLKRAENREYPVFKTESGTEVQTVPFWTWVKDKSGHWSKEVYKYSDDLIRYRVEAGLITPEFANALKKRYPHYIPTFREEGTNSKRARSARRNGGIVVSNAIGRAVGSDGVLLPLHTALSRKTVSTMRNAGLNQFGLALVRRVRRERESGGEVHLERCRERVHAGGGRH